MSDEECRSSRRSSRSRAKNSSRSQALELLKQCRKDGKSHRQNVEELDDDLYEEIDEDEYIKRYGDDDFVEDDDGGGYAETGEDYFDEDDYGTKKKEKKPKAKKGAIDNYFAKVVTKPALKEEKAAAEPDEDLDAMLAQIENADGTELVAKNAEEFPEKSFLPSRNKFKRSPSPTFTSPKPLKIRKREVVAKPAIVSVSELDLSVNDMDFDSQVPSPVRPLTPIDDVAVEPVVTETAEPINEEVTFNQFSAIQIGEIVEEDQSTTVSYGIPTDFLVDQEDGTKNLRFYWFDAFEDAKNPSRVCLFGAVKTGLNTFESCCVVVENILRRIFFIKREESEQLALYDEVKNLLTKTGVKTSLARPVKRKLAYMDGETPEVADCLEVFYDFNLPGFPAGLTHGTNFNRIGNATVTALERLLIERDIRGPCWLEISGVKEIEMNQKISHCQKEFHVSLPVEKPLLTSINVISDWQNEPLPISRLMAVNVVTVGNNKTHKPEIVLISVMRSKNYVFNKQTPVKWEKAVCFVCPPTGGTIPFQFQAEATKRSLNVEKLANENALLNRFLIELKNFDPDVIVGHDLASQFQILRDRIEEKNLAAQKWSVLGRLKRSSNLKQMPSNKQFRWSLTAGRLLLDSKAAAMELLHCQSYDLDELVHQVLAPVMPNANRRSLGDEQISKAFLDSSGKTDNLFGLIEWSFCDAHFATLILAHLNAMPLFLQITQIVGGVLSRTLMGGRAERNEYLLLHAFFKDNYIAPDKLPPKFGKKTEVKKENEDENQPTNSKKAQYTGGLVLEPKKGLYETFIVLLDFNSLYPSIIQEFNICFTTVKLQQREQANENDLPSMPDSSCPTGILPREIAKLVSSRRQVKNEMKKCPDKKSDRYKQYDIRQLGLKLTANSMYGCLGFEGSRFCAKTLAAMITFKGRQILESTKDLVESSGYTVIYGDTDSIMVNTNSTDLAAAKDIGSKIKWLINKNYKCLAMDIDGVYKRLLLLKKKKYAALSIDLNNEQKATREMKGLDIVRRDWSVLAKDVGERIVNIILESKQRDEMIEEIRETLKQVKVAIEEQKVSMEKFEILKKLTHKPEEYKDAKAQPHVQVALRLNQTRNTNYRQNDIIKYIICDDGTDQAATQRAYAKIEIESNKNLKVDSHYYLAQQIHPVVARLCEPIEEMDACQVAMALGLDPTGYRRKLKDQADDFMNDENNDPGLEAEFNACDGFALECPDCGKVQIIRSVINEDGRLSFSECPSCKLDLTQNALGIEIQLMEALQAAFKKCRESVYKCDDDMCNYTQTFKPMMKNNFGDVCPKCEIGFLKKEYTWRKLYIQQKFWLKIVNLHEFLAKEATPQQKKMIENDMKFTRLSKYHDVWTKRVKDTVSQNAYSKVDLSHIFAPMEIV